MSQVDTDVTTSIERLTFRTDGDWLAAELAKFISAMNLIYKDFVIATLIDRDRDGRLILAFGDKPSFAAIPNMVVTFIPHDGPLLPTLDKSLSSWMDRTSMLAVATVRMSSPGLFSFEGLGEVVREIRELIKDVWFRNKVERELALIQLDYARKHLEAIHDLSNVPMDSGKVPPEVLEELAHRVAGALAFLQQLDDDGLLKEIPEHLDETA